MRYCIALPVAAVLHYVLPQSYILCIDFMDGHTDILAFCACLHTHTHAVAVVMVVSGITSVSADKGSCETNCANLSTSAQTPSHIKAVE